MHMLCTYQPSQQRAKREDARRIDSRGLLTGRPALAQAGGGQVGPRRAGAVQGPQHLARIHQAPPVPGQPRVRAAAHAQQHQTAARRCQPSCAAAADQALLVAGRVSPLKLIQEAVCDPWQHLVVCLLCRWASSAPVLLRPGTLAIPCLSRTACSLPGSGPALQPLPAGPVCPPLAPRVARPQTRSLRLKLARATLQPHDRRRCRAADHRGLPGALPHADAAARGGRRAHLPHHHVRRPAGARRRARVPLVAVRAGPTCVTFR